MLTVGIKYTQVQSEMQDLNVWLDNIDRMLREGNIQDIKVCICMLLELFSNWKGMTFTMAGFKRSVKTAWY